MESMTRVAVKLWPCIRSLIFTPVLPTGYLLIIRLLFQVLALLLSSATAQNDFHPVRLYLYVPNHDADKNL